jgi:hypothetical protein
MSKSGPRFAPDFMIMQRRKEEDFRRLYDDKVKTDSSIGRVAHWEHKTSNRCGARRAARVPASVGAHTGHLAVPLAATALASLQGLPLLCCEAAWAAGAVCWNLARHVLPAHLRALQAASTPCRASSARRGHDACWGVAGSRRTSWRARSTP